MTPYGGYGPMIGFPSISNPVVNDVVQEGMQAAVTGNYANNENPTTASDALRFDYKNLDSWFEELWKKYNSGDEAAGEKLFNYVATQQQTKQANDWTAQREDTAYQRLVADLTKAGISPYILSGANPSVSQAATSSTSGSQMTSRQSQLEALKREGINSAATIIGRILMMMGVIVAAAL